MYETSTNSHMHVKNYQSNYSLKYILCASILKDSLNPLNQEIILSNHFHLGRKSI